MPSAAEDLNIALFPGVSWLPEIANYQAGQALDPLLLFEVMRKAGIHVDIIDPYRLPADPFARSNQLYRGLVFMRAGQADFKLA